MNESDYKTAIVKKVRAANRRNWARRVEDKFQVGFPDLIVRMEGCPVCFIEAKVVSAPTFGPTPRQYVELLDINAYPYAVALVLGIAPASGKIPTLYYFSPPRPYVEIKITEAFTDFVVGLHRHLEKIA